MSRAVAGFVLCLGLSACNEPRPEGALPMEEAIELLGRHRDAFERFEDWARRTAAADSAYGGPSALEEIAFSPVRREETIALARIDRDGDGDLHLSHPRAASLPDDLVYASAAGGDGIEVARATVVEGDERTATEVLSRSRTLESGATLRVTVAFTAATE